MLHLDKTNLGGSQGTHWLTLPHWHNTQSFYNEVVIRLYVTQSHGIDIITSSRGEFDPFLMQSRYYHTLFASLSPACRGRWFFFFSTTMGSPVCVLCVGFTCLFAQHNPQLQRPSEWDVPHVHWHQNFTDRIGIYMIIMVYNRHYLLDHKLCICF